MNTLPLKFKRAPDEHKMNNDQFYISNSARIIVATCCRLGSAHHTHEAHTPSLSSREAQLMDDLLPHKSSLYSPLLMSISGGTSAPHTLVPVLLRGVFPPGLRRVLLACKDSLYDGLPNRE